MILKLLGEKMNSHIAGTKCKGECTCTFIHLVGHSEVPCIICGCKLIDHPEIPIEEIDKLWA